MRLKNKSDNLLNPVAKDYYNIIYKAIDGTADDLFDMINLTVALTMVIQGIQEDMSEHLKDISEIGDDAFHFNGEDK